VSTIGEERGAHSSVRHIEEINLSVAISEALRATGQGTDGAFAMMCDYLALLE
jgi:hypothetical protein